MKAKGAVKAKGPARQTDADVLFRLTQWLMEQQMQPEPARRSARRLVNDLSRRGYESLVYGDLLPGIVDAGRDPERGVKAALCLGMLLEQLRRMPIIVQDQGRQARAKARNKGDLWLAEVEARPSGITVDQMYSIIAAREGMDPVTGPEAVERAVTRARAKRRAKLAV